MGLPMTPKHEVSNDLAIVSEQFGLAARAHFGDHGFLAETEHMSCAPPPASLKLGNYSKNNETWKPFILALSPHKPKRGLA